MLNYVSLVLLMVASVITTVSAYSNSAGSVGKILDMYEPASECPLYRRYYSIEN
jgi:hypothetical protein